MQPIKRKSANGTDVLFRHIGSDITPTEKLKDKWAAIPPAPNMTVEEQETMTMLEDRLSVAKERHLKHIDLMNASYLQFRSVNYYTKLYGAFPTYWNEWGAGVFIPRTFEVVEAARAQLKSKEPDFSLEPNGKKNSDYSKEVNILMHSEFKRSHSHDEQVDALDDAVIWGAGIVRNDLINEIEDQQILSFDDNGNLKYTPTTVTTYYGVGSRRTDPYDFFPDPSPDAVKINGRPGKRETGLGYCFVRTISDVESLRTQYKALFENGTYGVTENYKYLKPGGDLTDYKYLRSYIDDLYPVRKDIRYPSNVSSLLTGTGQHFASDQPYSQGKIEVYEYFERDRRIVFAMGMILIDTPNPYPHKLIPFSKMVLFDTKTFWSMGYPELMRWMQVIENTLYDQGLNNIVMNVHKMFAVNSRYIEDEGELVVRPFGIVHLKPIPGVSVNDAMQEIKFSPLANDYFNFLTLSKQNISTLTGQSEFSTGGVTKEAKVERATVANRIASGTIMRINQIARHFEKQIVEDSVEQMLSIAQFYYQISLGGEDSLDLQYQNGSTTETFKYLPKKMESMTENEMSSAMTDITKDNGYKGLITWDQIQGMYKVCVRGGSTIALDPDDEANLKMQFVDWARSLVDSNKITGYDAKGMPIGAPIFDINKLAPEVAKDVFKISNPDEFLFHQEEQPQQPQPAPGGPVEAQQQPNGPQAIEPGAPGSQTAPPIAQQR